MKILVTGGIGYIGSHTVVELLAEGFEVVIVDNLSNSDLYILKGIEKITGKQPVFYPIDLCKKEELHDFFSKEKNFTSIIHFAAYKSVSESMFHPLKYYQNNIISLLYLMEFIREEKISNFIFSSSCTVYGAPDRLPVTEEEIFKPSQSVYGRTKQMCEWIMKDFCKANLFLNNISLRYFNPVGAHSSAYIGELPLGVPTNLVPLITQVAAGKREKLQVYGHNYSTPDGTPIRDYVHVVDIAKAHILALKYQLNGKQKKNHLSINLGSGKGYSVLEVIDAFEKVTGIALRHSFVDKRPGDVEQIYADNTMAKKKLNWDTKISLDMMMETAWKWQKRIDKLLF